MDVERPGRQPAAARRSGHSEFGADGTASGSDGCNRFSTTYTQDGASLTIDQPMASTMMACEDAVMTQASAYMAALAATTGFLGGDRQLVLTEGDQFMATFVAGISRQARKRAARHPRRRRWRPVSLPALVGR
ncbi:MAG: META domain-containing protein [Caldilineales bacterium]